MALVEDSLLNDHKYFLQVNLDDLDSTNGSGQEDF